MKTELVPVYTASCQDCEWESGGTGVEHSQAKAALEHNRNTGHTVIARKVITYVYKENKDIANCGRR